MPTPEEIAAIRAKAVSERTDDEKAILQEADSGKGKDIQIPKSRFDEVNARLKLAEDRAAAAEKAAKDAQDAALKEKNDYKTLYESTKAEKDALAPKAAQVDDMEKTLGGLLAAQVAEMPEDRRGLVPAELTTQQKLNWIAQNRAVLMAPKPFDIGAGKQGGDGSGNHTQQVKLEPEEAVWADKLGMTAEEYAKNK